MARVFSAVDLTSPELKDELEKIRNRLDLGFRPVSKHKMHVTFQFFRDIEESQIEELKQTIRDAELESFRAEVKGVGAFPSRDYIRVVWAGFRDEEKLMDLHSRISGHSVVPDNTNSFKPHITLLRVRNANREQKRKLQRTIREFEDHSFGEMEVNELKIYRSELEEGGSKYSELYSRQI